MILLATLASAVFGMSAAALDDTTVREAVAAWHADADAATSVYGPISAWDVSRVTTMEGLFEGAAAFNADLSRWRVSRVTTMKDMFKSASTFQGDISQWDVSRVQSFARMFLRAQSFDGDLRCAHVARAPSRPQHTVATEPTRLPCGRPQRERETQALVYVCGASAGAHSQPVEYEQLPQLFCHVQACFGVQQLIANALGHFEGNQHALHV